ncbi:MAG TPA: glycosyltransferase family 9 protein [Burkholderiales bacterium]|nr:glycosyltransferase family 9 protein [Burkholderiales bacterium]
MNWEQARNVLCVRLDSLGDVLMTTPAIRALRESVAGRRITLLTSPSGAKAARLVPEIDAVVEFRAPWMKPATEGPAADAVMKRRLAHGKYDAAVIFSVYSQNPLPAAYLCYLAGIPLRLAHCHENPYHLLTHWVADPEPANVSRHEVRRQLDLVESVGSRTNNERLSMAVPKPAKARARRLLHALGITLRKPLVLVHPGATAASRRYPPAQFAQAMSILGRRIDCEIVFTGGAEEKPLIEGIRLGMDVPSHSAAGLMELGELGAAIECADVMVSNNTGPVHMAAALGTPVVDLYALTNPQHTPWQVANKVLFHDVACRNCYKSSCPLGHHDCLRRVQPETVAAAALELLGSRPSLRFRATGRSRVAGLIPAFNTIAAGQ